ncbi:MAG: LacI family DNA-binding transcriptional regulator [Lachnospiraceae bacterium]|nr:LacI family DNA-binding transcriptional regulator [Lachnospiraceae bacterium]
MSIVQIAKKVGVSPSTVSRVLNNPNYRCSSEELRKAIWQTAIEMNYTPNEAAKRLKQGKGLERQKTYYINVLLTHTDELAMDPFFRELLDCVETEVHSRFCVLSKVWVNSLFSDDAACDKANLSKVVAEMYGETEGKADALIIIGRCNGRALSFWRRKYRSVVSINRNPTDGAVDEITCDGSKVARMAVEYLIGLGHTKIAYVGECRGEARYRGFVAAMESHGLSVNPDYVFDRQRAWIEADVLVRLMMSMEESPTGIYCANDITAVGLLWALTNLRGQFYRPSVIASDDIEEGQRTKPMLTTVRLFKEDMSRHAMYLLLDRLQGGHEGVIRMDVQPQIVERGSTAPVEAGGWFQYER